MAGSVQPAGSVCQAFVAQAPVDGAAFTVMTSDALRDTLCASDEVIAAVEELQFSLGEGPCLEAFTTRRPVLVSDVQDRRDAGRWPVFAAGTAGLQVGGLFAFPMQLGAITVGVCVAYRRRAGRLDGEEVAALLQAVDVATLSLLVVRAGEPDVELADYVFDSHGAGRPLVHQATGMLTVQLGVSAEEAFSRLRAHAYGNGRSMDEVAADIVGRRMHLAPERT